MSELELKIEKLIKDQILITESEAQDLATLICNLPEINGGRVGAEVSPDFWRIFVRKLTTEYAYIRGLEDENSILIKKILEPFIDALIKTEQEIYS